LEPVFSGYALVQTRGIGGRNWFVVDFGMDNFHIELGGRPFLSYFLFKGYGSPLNSPPKGFPERSPQHFFLAQLENSPYMAIF